MAESNVNFQYFLGDNTLEVEATVTPFIPERKPDLNGPGDPAEGGEVEINGVWISHPDTQEWMPFSTADIIVKNPARPTIPVSDLDERLEEQALEVYLDQGE